MESLEEITNESAVERKNAGGQRQYSGYAGKGAKAGIGLTLLLLSAGLYCSPAMRDGTLRNPGEAAVGYSVMMGLAAGIGAFSGHSLQGYRNGEE